MRTLFSDCRNTDLVSVVRGCKCRCRGGKAGTCPCEDLRITGTNILRDAEWEGHIGNTGGGPLGNEIPSFIMGETFTHVGLEWSDFSSADDVKASTGWVVDQDYITNPDPFFQVVSTGTPDAGSYHLRGSNVGVSSGNSPICFVVNAESCPPKTPFLYGGKVDTGDLVSWSVRAKETAGTIRIFLGFDLFDEDGVYYTGVIPTLVQDITSTYATYSLSWVIPSYGLETYVRPWFSLLRVGAPAITGYVDSAIMGVA